MAYLRRPKCIAKGSFPAMGRRYEVRPLPLSRLPQVYPLVHAIAPRLGLGEWLAHGRTLCAAGREREAGLIAAQGADGYIYGLFSYRILPDIQHGRTFRVENFVALDLVDGAGAAEALIAAIDSLARKMDCVAVHVMVAQQQGTRVALDERRLGPFFHAGYGAEGIGMCKRLLPEPRAHVNALRREG